MASSEIMVASFTFIALVLAGVTWLICDAPGLAWRAVQRNGKRVEAAVARALSPAP